MCRCISRDIGYITRMDRKFESLYAVFKEGLVKSYESGRIGTSQSGS